MTVHVAAPSRAFAYAIARAPRAVLIDEDDERRSWMPLDCALASGRAFAVEVRGDILAIDADSPVLGTMAEAFAARLRSDGRVPVVVASGRPGHRHVFDSSAHHCSHTGTRS